MRFAALFTAVSVVAGVVASPLSVDIDLGGLLGIDLTPDNHYGAPHPPWTPGALPGWYFGDHPDLYPQITFLEGVICSILKLFPYVLQCPVKPPKNPPPSDGYTQTFANLTGATQAGDYMTYGLVDTVADCKAMCNAVSGCNFVNSYHDVNGKGGSTQLTCSLFTSCHTSADADNKGGQTQPDGSVDFITDSDGYCKDS